MPAPSAPSNVFLQQGNAQVLVSWDITATATSYTVQRSIDGVTFTTVASPTVPSFLDTTVIINTQYWYQVAAVNGTGSSGFTATDPGFITPTITGQLSLGQIRLMAQERADMVNSNFITKPEWNTFINQAAFELYDLLITCYEDYNVRTAFFTTNSNQQNYLLPNGQLTFQDENGNNFVAPPFYKGWRVDLGLNNAPNGFVTIHKYNAIDGNKYVFPNTASTIYGVFNLQYRFVDRYINFIPTPSSNQPIRLWYIPRMPILLQDSDVVDGYSGWTQYIIVRAAKYALDKEESDSSTCTEEIGFLKDRIEASAQNRDAGQGDTISNTRGASGWGSNGGFGFGGPGGYGW
jgi:hypothetical protein